MQAAAGAKKTDCDPGPCPVCRVDMMLNRLVGNDTPDPQRGMLEQHKGSYFVRCCCCTANSPYRRTVESAVRSWDGAIVRIRLIDRDDAGPDCKRVVAEIEWGE